MARRCKTAEFARLVERAREQVPLFNVTTDVIVGFPGETDAEWRQTLAFVEALGFGHLHIFPFSARAGTKAARLPGQVDAGTRKARAAELHALGAEMKRRELLRHVGGRAAVLWERRLGDGSGPWSGYTPHYHRILSTDPSLRAATISEVSIDGLADDGGALLGRAPGAAPVPIAVGFDVPAG